ncbi:MAG: deoxyribonuclease V [Phycisphaerae bacterium]
MKLPPMPHRWDVSPQRAIQIQRELVDRVRVEPLARPVRLVAGVDAAASRDGSEVIAGIVVWDIAARRLVQSCLASRTASFPYVPGLLSFREAPAVLAAVRKLPLRPDVFIFDGQGLAHPRRLGLASHLGVLMDQPSVGCAKSRLFGRHDRPGPRRGSHCPLRDPADASLIGAVLRTREAVKPVYVSIGHRVRLQDAVAVVLDCCTRYRLPEPTRLAHQLVTRHRRQR